MYEVYTILYISTDTIWISIRNWECYNAIEIMARLTKTRTYILQRTSYPIDYRAAIASIHFFFFFNSEYMALYLLYVLHAQMNKNVLHLLYLNGRHFSRQLIKLWQFRSVCRYSTVQTSLDQLEFRIGLVILDKFKRKNYVWFWSHSSHEKNKMNIKHFFFFVTIEYPYSSIGCALHSPHRKIDEQ